MRSLVSTLTPPFFVLGQTGMCGSTDGLKCPGSSGQDHPSSVCFVLPLGIIVCASDIISCLNHSLLELNGSISILIFSTTATVLTSTQTPLNPEYSYVQLTNGSVRTMRNLCIQLLTRLCIGFGIVVLLTIAVVAVVLLIKRIQVPLSSTTRF